MAARVPPERGAYQDLVQHVSRIARDSGRTDLAEKLDSGFERLTRPDVTVVVVGEFKQGKSSLVNALVGIDVCAVDDDVATAVPTLVGFGAAPTAVLYRADAPAERLDVGSLAARTQEAGNGATEPDGTARDSPVVAVEASIPAPLLEAGLRLVDTPGVGGLDSTVGAKTLATVSAASGVLFVSDATQEITAPELEFLQRVRRLCPDVALVMPKADLCPHWRAVADANRRHLDAFDDPIPVFTTSAPLSTEAARRRDDGMAAESGVPALTQWLTDLNHNASDTAASTLAADLQRSVALLVAPLVAERRALADPDAARAVTTELEDATARVERLRSAAARWQQTLADGITDLTSDLSFNLRIRLRSTAERFDEVIEHSDPVSAWAELTEQLDGMIREVLVAANEDLVTGVRALAVAVAAHFDDDESAAEVGLSALGSSINAAGALDPRGLPEGSTASAALTAVRGSYSGILMLNMFGALVGLTMVAPISLGLGVVLGARAVRNERERRRTVARQALRQSAQRHVDAVSQRITKEMQDQLRLTSRVLRDTFSERAAELQRSTAAALEAARTTARTGDAERAARRAEVEEALAALTELRTRAHALAAGGGTP